MDLTTLVLAEPGTLLRGMGVPRGKRILQSPVHCDWGNRGPKSISGRHRS